MLGQLHAVVGDELVDVAVLVALGLRMANQYNHLRRSARW
jgi:3-deoxy-D-manno-octulosonate 8-phosphate phosphatase KdsC-like HAD superfamily phosphatase